MYAKYNKDERGYKSGDRYDDEWRRIRNNYIVDYPFCEVCRKYGKLVRATEVHHIKPISEGGSNDYHNLISLCHSCHTKAHAQRGDYKTKVYSYGETS